MLFAGGAVAKIKKVPVLMNGDPTSRCSIMWRKTYKAG